MAISRKRKELAQSIPFIPGRLHAFLPPAEQGEKYFRQVCLQYFKSLDGLVTLPKKAKTTTPAPTIQPSIAIAPSEVAPPSEPIEEKVAVQEPDEDTSDDETAASITTTNSAESNESAHERYAHVGPGCKPHYISMNWGTVAEQVRIATYEGTWYAHAVDVASVIVRKSNISRLFGRYRIPTEKRRLSVLSSRSSKLGQNANVLSSAGVRRWRDSQRVQRFPAYVQWIDDVLLPAMSAPIEEVPVFPSPLSIDERLALTCSVTA